MRNLVRSCYPRFVNPPEGGLREDAYPRLSGDERGISQTIALIFSVIVLLMLIGMGVLVSHVYPVKVAVHAAARNCTRMGVESLSQGRGVDQAYTAAYQTMAHHNFDPQYVQVVIQHDGWDRGGVVTCRVRYGVDVSWMPFVGSLFDDAVRLEGAAASRIEPYKSRWEEE